MLTPGRRLEIEFDPESGRPDLNLVVPKMEPGDYVGPIHGYTGPVPSVYFILPVEEGHPDSGLRHVASPPHTFIEEDDGTLTVQPSILARRSGGDGWHGYLEHGQWREV